MGKTLSERLKEPETTEAFKIIEDFARETIQGNPEGLKRAIKTVEELASRFLLTAESVFGTRGYHPRGVYASYRGRNGEYSNVIAQKRLLEEANKLGAEIVVALRPTHVVVPTSANISNYGEAGHLGAIGLEHYLSLYGTAMVPRPFSSG